MFTTFSKAVEAQFNKMKQHKLLEVDVSKNELYDLYLSSFPEGTNPIYAERTEHDCNCCKSFIRDIGNAVAIIDNEIVTIWDIEVPNFYQEVANALAAHVRTARIKQPLSVHQLKVGVAQTHQQTLENTVKTWNHFHAEVPTQNVAIQGETLSNIQSTVAVGLRGLSEIDPEAVSTILELIAQNSIYRGEEHQMTLVSFQKLQAQFKALETSTAEDIFIWTSYKKPGFRIRNSVIGTLVVDLSEGVELEKAVKSFEAKVAPTNYKRPKALITPIMIKKATETIQAEGIEDSLKRRFATPEDISVNNVLFVDRSTATVMKDANSIEDLLMAEVKPNHDFSKAEKISIADFTAKVLPTIQSLEVMVENRHKANLVSLIAPTVADAPNILKWDNNFSWSYAGGVADSDLRQRVEAAGGRVDGVFRFTHSWNEIEPNASLMDLHVFMPGCSVPSSGGGPDVSGRRVGWNNRKDYSSQGVQDVDYTSPAPKNYIPVENITFPNINTMPEGTYVCKIHNWKFRSTGGKGKAEIEINGNLYNYTYPSTEHHEWITVAEVTLKNGQFSISHKLPLASSTQEVWSIKTYEFEPVSMVTISPNHWDDQAIGNKHFFFMLKNCINEEQPRGFYNEFLNNKYDKHRKVFEILAGKTKPEIVDHQLSGVGFSSTKRDNLIVKVHGNITRVLDIQF